MNHQKKNDIFRELYDLIISGNRRDFFGNVPQPQLSRELLRHKLYLNPSTFEEASCIFLMESMAANVPIITGRLGAIPETTMMNAVIIDKNPLSDEYAKEFVKNVVALLNNENEYKRLQRNARVKILKWNLWPDIAEDWNYELNYLLGRSNEVLNKYPVQRAWEYSKTGKKNLSRKILEKVSQNKIEDTFIRYPHLTFKQI